MGRTWNQWTACLLSADSSRYGEGAGLLAILANQRRLDSDLSGAAVEKPHFDVSSLGSNDCTFDQASLWER